MQAIFDHRNSFAQRMTFIGLTLIILFSIVAALYFDAIVLFGLPLVPIVLFVSIVDFKKLYYLLYAAVPISIAIEVGGGISTDLPSEPIMLGLSFIAILHLMSNRPKAIGSFLKHPITLLLILHLAWTLVSAINSPHSVIGIKFFLAKMWYVLPFYFLSGMLLTDNRSIIKVFKFSVIPMTILILIILARHSLEGFSFSEVNFVMGPSFINHVAYGALVAILLPFVILLLNNVSTTNGGFNISRKWKVLLFSLFVFALFQSFCRAAIVAVVIAIGAYFVINLKLIKPAIYIALIGLTGVLVFLEHNNKYLDYAPEYTQAVSHQKFDKLISATSEGKDVSTMERIYRWVAGSRMIANRPIVGFGPGSFPAAYKPYTVNNFKTYVSKNEDGSSIHSTYLMQFVDQGIVGGLIFLILTIVSLVAGQRIYYETIDALSRQIVLSVLLCLIIINAMNLINDLLESDKVGAYYFTCLAVLVIIDIRNRTVNRPKNVDA